MAKNDKAARLLRSLSEVDDKYIEEAMEVKSGRKAVTTSLRRNSGIISALVAAALLLVVGGTIFGVLSNRRDTTRMESADMEYADTRDIAAHNVEVDAEIQNAVSLDTRSGGNDEEAPAAAAEEVIEYDAPADEQSESLGADTYTVQIVNPMTEADDLDALTGMTGIPFDVPESVEGSAYCRYYCYDLGGYYMNEVMYFNEDDECILTIRKAPGEEIGGVYVCYAVIHKVDVPGIGSVSLSGNGEEFGLARWNDGEYAYSIHSESMISEDDMLGLVGQIS